MNAALGTILCIVAVWVFASVWISATYAVIFWNREDEDSPMPIERERPSEIVLLRPSLQVERIMARAQKRAADHAALKAEYETKLIELLRPSRRR